MNKYKVRLWRLYQYKIKLLKLKLVKMTKNFEILL